MCDRVELQGVAKILVHLIYEEVFLTFQIDQ